MSRQALSKHALPTFLPQDAKALRFEERGLWRRAARRWRQVLMRTADCRQAEALVQRQRYCLQQVIKPRGPGDGTTPEGYRVSDVGPASGPAFWRTG